MHSSCNLKTPSVPIYSSFYTISSTPTKPNLEFCHKNPIFFPSLKNSSAPTKPIPQFCHKNPILLTSVKNLSTPTKPKPQCYSKNSICFSSLENSSIPTKQKPQFSHKNPILFTSVNYSAKGCYSNYSRSRTTGVGVFSVSCLMMEEPPLEKLTVVDKVKSLSLEFRSLSEPIDRVKRLLHYASILPPFSESARVTENRVLGCTTQVWLEVKMDKRGSMRFRVDSDSEITKGFCSCLIWLLDGAEPEEILSVTADDLSDMNVGLPKSGRSRVNTWHNVLFSMQNRTHDCVQQRERALSLEDFHSLVVRPHGHGSSSGSYLESEPKCSFEVK